MCHIALRCPQLAHETWYTVYLSENRDMDLYDQQEEIRRLGGSLKSYLNWFGVVVQN